MLCVVNLAKTVEMLDFDLKEIEGERLVEVFGQNVFPKIDRQKYVFVMQPHSFFWFEFKNKKRLIDWVIIRSSSEK